MKSQFDSKHTIATSDNKLMHMIVDKFYYFCSRFFLQNYLIWCNIVFFPPLHPNGIEKEMLEKAKIGLGGAVTVVSKGSPENSDDNASEKPEEQLLEDTPTTCISTSEE